MVGGRAQRGREQATWDPSPLGSIEHRHEGSRLPILGFASPLKHKKEEETSTTRHVGRELDWPLWAGKRVPFREGNQDASESPTELGASLAQNRVEVPLCQGGTARAYWGTEWIRSCEQRVFCLHCEAVGRALCHRAIDTQRHGPHSSSLRNEPSSDRENRLSALW